MHYYWNELQYPFIRETKQNVLCDVDDGSIMNMLMMKSYHPSTDVAYLFSVCNLPPEICLNKKFIFLSPL